MIEYAICWLAVYAVSVPDPSPPPANKPTPGHPSTPHTTPPEQPPFGSPEPSSRPTSNQSPPVQHPTLAESTSPQHPTLATPTASTVPTSPQPVSPDIREGPSRPRFTACNPGSDPCVRSRPARVLLATTGAVVGLGGGALLLLTLGDSRNGGDPGGILVGGGALALGGAVLGSLIAIVSRDQPGRSDRIRPATLGLGLDFPGRAWTDEVNPAALRMEFAPTYWLPSKRGRLRLSGHVGGLLGTLQDVDPRPQSIAPQPDLEGTYPVALRERQLSIGLTLDTAFSLPYPVLPATRSAHLGAAEFRYKPEVQIRRHTYQPGTDRTEVVERTMLLPLTFGLRWHLSERQRFTIYTGPRFDFLGASTPGTTQVQRGGGLLGVWYGEAWYDIDVPLTKPQARHQLNAQLSLGYVHSHFSGRGLDLGRVVGFFGPFRVDWHMRLRPASWKKTALQASIGAWVGNGITVAARLGVVLPDLGGQRAVQSGGSR